MKNRKHRTFEHIEIIYKIFGVACRTIKMILRGRHQKGNGFKSLPFFVLFSYYFSLWTPKIIQEHKHKLFDLSKIVLKYWSWYVVRCVALSVMGRY